jgi:hypothetical protein
VYRNQKSSEFRPKEIQIFEFGKITNSVTPKWKRGEDSQG